MKERIFHVQDKREEGCLELAAGESGNLSWGADSYAVFPTGDGGAILALIVHKEALIEEGLSFSEGTSEDLGIDYFDPDECNFTYLKGPFLLLDSGYSLSFERAVERIDTKKLSPDTIKRGGWIWNPVEGVFIAYTDRETHDQRWRKIIPKEKA